MQELSKQQDYNIIILVEFALALMTILDQINKESFQQFKLRIGKFLQNHKYELYYIYVNLLEIYKKNGFMNNFVK